MVKVCKGQQFTDSVQRLGLTSKNSLGAINAILNFLGTIFEKEIGEIHSDSILT